MGFFVKVGSSWTGVRSFLTFLCYSVIGLFFIANFFTSLTLTIQLLVQLANRNTFLELRIVLIALITLLLSWSLAIGFLTVLPVPVKNSAFWTFNALFVLVVIDHLIGTVASELGLVEYHAGAAGGGIGVSVIDDGAVA